MTEQILRLDSRPMASQIPRYNPRPAGVIRDGSATQAVLIFLRGCSGRWVNHHQIRIGTERSSKAVDFGLRYLRAVGLIECTADDSRNSRYMRYRAKE